MSKKKRMPEAPAEIPGTDPRPEIEPEKVPDEQPEIEPDEKPEIEPDEEPEIPEIQPDRPSPSEPPSIR